MRNFIAVIMTIIIAMTTFAVCKADTVEPFEEILDMIQIEYEYVPTTGERNNTKDTIIIAVDVNAIIISEKGSRVRDGYIFETYNDFAAATVAIITYIEANNTAKIYVSFGEDNISEVENIGQAIALQAVLVKYNKEMGTI